MNAGRAPVVAVLAVVTGLVLAGCGSHPNDRAEAAHTPSSSPGATGTPSPGTAGTEGATSTPHAGSTKSARPTTGPSQAVQESAVNGRITAVRKSTAQISSPGGVVGITWNPGTVIVNSVDARAKDLAVGTCVLVLPPEQGPAPTAKTITAGLVRVIAASPSCPPVPGATPGPGKGAAPQPGTAGSVTVTGGQGVIGSVSAKSRTGFTLRTRDGGRIRTVAVATSDATEYRKAGEHPREGVEVGRCATVWGTEHAGTRLVATRMRLSDPVDGACGS